MNISKKILSISVASILLFSSCNEVTSTQFEEVEQDMRNQLVHLGFTKELIEKDEYFIHDGYTYIYKKDIPQMVSESTTRQAMQGWYLRNKDASHVTYKVLADPGNLEYIREEVRYVIKEWNNTNSNLQFFEVGANENANITIQDYKHSGYYHHITAPHTICGGRSHCVSAALPTSNGAGGMIIVNYPTPGVVGITTRSKSLASSIAHGIGHTIGFDHAVAETGIHISGTPHEDLYSVMHPDMQAERLSEYDKLAVRTRFPKYISFNEGKYYHLKSVGSGMLLDNDGSYVNGGNVHQWGYVNGQPNQLWKIQNEGNGYYSLISKRSGKALDNTGTFQHLGNVHQWEYIKGHPNQLWKIKYEKKNGFFSLISKRSGKALDNDFGRTGNGHNVHQCNYTPGHPNQTWDIIEEGSFNN